MAIRQQVAVGLLAGVATLTTLGLYLRRKVTVINRCPACGNTHADRYPRRKFVKTYLGFLPLKAYHCTSCGHYFYRLKR